MTDLLEGRCACGDTRFRLNAKPMFVHCCHCRDCQRLTGSAFVVNAIIEGEAIELLSGEPKPEAVPTASGRPHDIYRCENCHTALWSDYGRRPNYRFVRAGTLEDPSAITPDVHIFARSKLPWVKLPDEARVFDVFYDVEAEWPADSMKRRKAVLGD